MARDFGKYIFMLTEYYLPIADSENGDFRRLPFEGDVLDQPYMTMEVLKLMQHNFRKEIEKRSKAKVSKGK